MNVGDIFIQIGIWVFKAIDLAMPTDIGGAFNSFKSFLADLKTNLINFFSIISIYLDLKILFLVIILMISLPSIYLTITLIKSIIKIAKR